MKSYFDEVIEKLEAMSDEEFMESLYAAGLEKCPYEDEKDKSVTVGIDLSNCKDGTVVNGRVLNERD